MITAPALFADGILWHSRDAAEAAAARLPTLPGSDTFMSAIAEMRAFTHVAVMVATHNGRAI